MRIVSVKKDVTSQDEELIKVKEAAILMLGELLAKTGQADGINHSVNQSISLAINQSINQSVNLTFSNMPAYQEIQIKLLKQQNTKQFDWKTTINYSAIECLLKSFDDDSYSFYFCDDSDEALFIFEL